jgi:hypothetical protein
MLLSWYAFNLIWLRLPKLVIIGNHDTRQRKYGLNSLYNTWSLVYEKECIIGFTSRHSFSYTITGYWTTYVYPIHHGVEKPLGSPSSINNPIFKVKTVHEKVTWFVYRLLDWKPSLFSIIEIPLLLISLEALSF